MTAHIVKQGMRWISNLACAIVVVLSLDINIISNNTLVLPIFYFKTPWKLILYSLFYTPTFPSLFKVFTFNSSDFCTLFLVL